MSSCKYLNLEAGCVDLGQDTQPASRWPSCLVPAGYRPWPRTQGCLRINLNTRSLRPVTTGATRSGTDGLRCPYWAPADRRALTFG
jgi:hypothetical protein